MFTRDLSFIAPILFLTHAKITRPWKSTLGLPTETKDQFSVVLFAGRKGRQRPRCLKLLCHAISVFFFCCFEMLKLFSHQAVYCRPL